MSATMTEILNLISNITFIVFIFCAIIFIITATVALIETMRGEAK